MLPDVLGATRAAAVPVRDGSGSPGPAAGAGRLGLDVLLELPRTVAAVSPADIQRVARAYLLRQRLTVGWMVPGSAPGAALGLFALVVNGLMLWLTSSLSQSLGLGFHVSGFWPAFWGALVVSLVSTLLSLFVGSDNVRVQKVHYAD